MNEKIITLSPGLTFVATPIGRARDITLHALDVLASADVLVAEDTRVLRKLLDIHGICIGARRVLSYHDHNAHKVQGAILHLMNGGKSVAFTSDAGTPLVSDPGYDLAVAAYKAGIDVTMAPGPSAAIMGLALSGLATHSFYFGGFLPNTAAARLTALQNLNTFQTTLIFYESPRRLLPCLHAMAKVFGPSRQAAVCRELTKRFEDVRQGPLENLIEAYTNTPPKGECVVVVQGHCPHPHSADDIDDVLRQALQTMHIKEAATTVSGALGISRRDVYQRALALNKASSRDDDGSGDDGGA